jgi:N-acetylglucosaminyldiphosphoundecaprenol N-acetyl-beta-D-mannosaminyltransferase
MIKTVFFLKIKFSNNRLKDFKNIIKKRGLFLFPSGPGLSTLEDDKQYYESLKKADINFFDSGYFVLLLKLLKNINVNKCSGYLFVKYFLEYLKYYKTNIKIMSVDPSKNLSISIKMFILKDYLKKKKLINYVAPFYNNHNITDPTLLKIIKKKKPRFIIINIGGGIQELLGLYLKKNLNYKPTIICTGGALMFLTGDQAPISVSLDRFYLGWFVRILYNPKTFLVRYIKAFKLFYIVWNNKITIK